MRTTRPPSEARQRILETADKLFYLEGIRAVGIDRIIAEADVAKMSLYKHFPSKDDLILEVLKFREAEVLQFFSMAMERHGKRTKDKLRSFFAALKDWFESPGFRGCAFQNAALELANPDHPGAQFVKDHKKRFQQMLSEFIDQSLGRPASRIGFAIGLLVEGAIVTAVIQGSTDPVDVAREASLKLADTDAG